MNAQTLKRLAAALAAVLLVWLVATMMRRSTRDEAVRLELGPVATGSVDRVIVVKGIDSLRFVRQGDGWTVNGMRADAALVDGMVRALGDTSARSELVAKSPASHARLGLESGSARRVSARQGDKVVADLLVGTRGSSYGTVHVRRPGSDASYLLANGLADISDRQVDDWRDKLIAKVEPESVSMVEVTSGRTAWRLSRDSTAWTLGTEPADSAAVASYLDRFRTVTAAGFASATQADSADFLKPDKVVRVWARGNRPLLQLTADSSASGVWVRREGDPTTFRLDTWVFGGLVPDASSLRRR